MYQIRVHMICLEAFDNAVVEQLVQLSRRTGIVPAQQKGVELATPITKAPHPQKNVPNENLLPTLQ